MTEEVGLDFTVGYTTRGDIYDRNGTRSVGQQVYGVLRHFNFEQQDEIQYYERRNIRGLYGQASFDYNRYAYLELLHEKIGYPTFQNPTVRLSILLQVFRSCQRVLSQS